MRDRGKELVPESRPVGNQRSEEAAVVVGVGIERRGGFVERAVDEGRRAVVERMGDGRRRLDQRQVELERTEERRSGDERMDGRADVVAEARERQLCRARPAADRLSRLVDSDRASGLRERDRRREAVWPGADDDRV
jgi:hypothetical protein